MSGDRATSASSWGGFVVLDWVRGRLRCRSLQVLGVRLELVRVWVCSGTRCGSGTGLGLSLGLGLVLFWFWVWVWVWVWDWSGSGTESGVRVGELLFAERWKLVSCYWREVEIGELLLVG